MLKISQITFKSCLTICPLKATKYNNNHQIKSQTVSIMIKYTYRFNSKGLNSCQVTIFMSLMITHLTLKIQVLYIYPISFIVTY